MLTSDKSYRVRIREITQTDEAAVVDLLTRGFGKPRRYWEVGLNRLRIRAAPDAAPRYGYILEADGRAVGAILVISSLRQRGAREVLFSNLSSWYVEAGFRSYAPLLHKRAVINKLATYLNISAAPHTQLTIETLGFKCYSKGQIAAVLPLARNRYDGRVHIIGVDCFDRCSLDAQERRLLITQLSYGCIAFCCVVQNTIRPFAFVPRLIRGSIPCVQLAYCRDIIDLVDVAGTVGRYLLRLGRPLVLIDANGPIHGIPGKYFPGTSPKYYKGTDLPVLGDIADTEATILGF
jgi:hypothetical protein